MRFYTNSTISTLNKTNEFIKVSTTFDTQKDYEQNESNKILTKTHSPEESKKRKIGLSKMWKISKDKDKHSTISNKNLGSYFL